MGNEEEELQVITDEVDFEPRVTIVIPACSGAKVVSRTLNRVAAYLDHVEWPSEVIVVDDANGDDTLEVVGRWRDRFDSLVIVRHQRRRGAGAAARAGFLFAKGHYVILAESGFAARVEEVEVLISRLIAGADVAIASRKLDEQREGRRPLTGKLLTETAFAVASRLVLPTGVNDMFSGLLGFRQRAARLIATRSKITHAAYLVEWMALAQYLGHHVIECPVRLVQPAGGRPLRGLLHLAKLGDLLSIRRRLAGFEYSRPQATQELMQETSFVRLDRDELIGTGNR